MTIEPGQQFRLLRDHGNPPLHLRAGMIGTVREVVDAATPGAHNDEEDAIVLVFPSHEVAYEGDQPTITTAPRAVAFAVNELDSTQPDPLFEEVREA